MRVTHRWQDSTCVVDVGPREMLDEITALYPDAEVSDDAGAAADVRVARTGRGITVTPRDSGPHLRTCDALFAAEHAITLHFLEGDRGHTHMHGAAALTENGAVLATGRSGAGKSTLAFTWANMGVPIFGDDVVPLDAEGLARTFPRLLKVDKQQLLACGREPQRTLAWDPEADDAWVDPRPLGGWATGGVPVAVVAEICYRPGADFQLEEVSGGDGLRLLLDSVQTTGVTREQSLDRLIGVTERSRIYRIEFGHSDEAASRLLGLAANALPR